MAGEDKPYRVYRGGRVKGRTPTLPRPKSSSRKAASPNGRPPGTPGTPGRRTRRRFGWKLRIGLIVLLVVTAVVAWGVASYLAFGRGVSEANSRLDPSARTALTQQDGLLLSTPTTILLLGTDHASIPTRAGARRSDSILLLRTDPERHRLAYLSIPRDLRVDVPGHGPNKINAAFQLGGAALATRTVRAVTGVEINHVATVDFDSFKGVIDAVDGISIDVPAPILSNPFDCPFATQARCDRWPGWRFARGEQTMDGRRALIYARVRENRLNPSENDLTRGARQQQVLNAVTAKLTSPTTLPRMPMIGDDVLEPLTTDLSAWEVLQLGWLRFRSSESRTLRCRLGGYPENSAGQAFLTGHDDNAATVAMFLGNSAPQPPLPRSDPLAPGCLVGSG